MKSLLTLIPDPVIGSLLPKTYKPELGHVIQFHRYDSKDDDHNFVIVEKRIDIYVLYNLKDKRAAWSGLNFMKESNTFFLGSVTITDHMKEICAAYIH